MPPSMPDQALPLPLPLPPPGTSPARRGVTPQSPLRIKQDGKFYERLLTKESSTGNLSFRYYWAEPGSVPFVWETQPGTPKDVAGMVAGALPAITPPPSYLLRHGNSKVAASSQHHQQGKRAPKTRKRCRLRRFRIGFVAGIFRRLCLRKAWRRPVDVSSSSSSRWLFCSPATERGGEHDDDDDVSAARQGKPVLCGSSSFRARPRPWLLRFRGVR